MTYYFVKKNPEFSIRNIIIATEYVMHLGINAYGLR